MHWTKLNLQHKKVDLITSNVSNIGNNIVESNAVFNKIY